MSIFPYSIAAAGGGTGLDAGISTAEEGVTGEAGKGRGTANKGSEK